ncbi:transglutaminaseTgpA domain-containing protein [Ideonella sp.]|uniref:transglutaminase family protein n=1 Tax=Ideonella sp. TaxID=1929293 RepID=UPI0037BFA1BD
MSERTPDLSLRWRWPQPPSREARDTLFMLALIAWTMAPHLPTLPVWVSVVSLGVLAWRARLAWTERPLPGRWSLIALVVLTGALTYWSERTLVGRQAGVTLLVVLMAAKTLELKARRDALVVFFLGFFLVLTNFLNSQSLLTAVGMTLSVWGWLTALTLAHMPAGTPPIRQAASLAAKATLWGTPVMVALFLLFPRLGPLWALPTDGARTGLSDQLKLGDVAKLATDDSIALRIRFTGAPQPANSLYFRGPVLTDYDGERWRASPGRPRPDLAEQALEARPLRYEMTLEPLQISWLPLPEFTVDKPVANPPLATLPAGPDNAGQWSLSAPLTQRVRLSGQALAQHPVRSLSDNARARLTALPPGKHPRSRAWALQLRSQPALQGATVPQLVEAVLQHVRQENFVYTLSPGAYLGDAVDEFWLGRRAGFCEHYAASFVVIMRAMGVPARIVTGYQGADKLLQDGQQVVRQSNAHAWAEVWQPEVGWLRVDPTAAVAPERVQQGQTLSAPPGLVLGAFDAVSPGLRQTLRRWAETLDNRWNVWVLSYGKDQQKQWLEQWGWGKVDAVSLLRLIVLIAATVGLLGALWAWRESRRQAPWQRLTQKILAELQGAGVAATAAQDPHTWALALRGKHGAAAQAATQALLDLHAQRYAPKNAQERGQNTTAWWRGFRQAMRSIPKPR